MNKIYNLTGIRESEAMMVLSTSNNGREMIVCSSNLDGAATGDTMLVDRPHYKRVPFKIEGIRYLPEQPKHRLIYAKFIEEHIGGYQKQLKLKFRKSK